MTPGESMEAEMMIKTKGLRKSFRSRKTTVEAVRGVDLTVEDGEVFGFLGPNGAGKTTTLRMLATLLVPDDGIATIAGADLRTRPGSVRRRIGYVAPGGSTWDEVRRLRADGMTVFLTPHYLEEADALCDRIAIIDHGEIVAEGTPDELKRQIAGDVVTVGLNGAT